MEAISRSDAKKKFISICESYLAMLCLPQVIHPESELKLQLLLEETLRRKIKIQADLLTVCNTPVHIVEMVDTCTYQLWTYVCYIRSNSCRRTALSLFHYSFVCKEALRLYLEGIAVLFERSSLGSNVY